MGLEAFLTHWGVAAVFVGAMAEGESFVIGGGALASRGLLHAWQVALAAFCGSVAMDQICFYLGRHFSTHRWICALRARPAFGRALDFIERHPTGYILAFRYLYGLRIVSPIAIGITSVATRRFVLLNMASAAVWAALFTGLGYLAGNAYEKLFGQVHSLSLFLLGMILLAVIGSAVAHHFLAKRVTAPAGDPPGSPATENR
jgi:membrane protein DedA with SNARE-associated domain